MTSEGAELLIKQGGVDAVIEASDVLGRDIGKTDASAATALSATSSKLLGRLLTADDVITAVEALAEVATAARKTKVPSVETMKPVISRVGHMATIGKTSLLPIYAGRTTDYT